MQPLALALILAASPEEAVRIPASTPGTVTLSLPDYNRLLDRASKPARPPEDPPVPAAVSSAAFRLRVDRGVVRGSARLEGEVFRSGLTPVPLLSRGTLLEARAGSELPSLMTDDRGQHALVRGPGPFAITLEWAAPVVVEPGRASFVLPTPTAGSARASLELPGGDADVRVEPGGITRRTSAAGRTMVELTLEPGRAARIWWSVRESVATAARPLRLLSEARTVAHLGEADLRLTTLFDVTVVEGEPERFEITLPAGFEVTSASGSSVEALPERPGVLVLTVTEPSRRRHQFLLALERALPDASTHVEVPLPSLAGAQRETGEVAVAGAGALELVAAEKPPLRRVDVTELAPSLRALAAQPLLAGFRYQARAEPVSLALDVRILLLTFVRVFRDASAY